MPIKFLCPVPGYDRHFALCEQFGIEMIPVPLSQNGPDLGQIRQLVADDPSIGMWIVPMYSNPTGAIYTEEVTSRAARDAGSGDFRMFWDNAYAVHHLTDVEAPALDVLAMAADVGHPNRVFLFASTSKITFAGAGVSFFASSPSNVDWYLKTQQADHRPGQDQSPRGTYKVSQGRRRCDRPDATTSRDSAPSSTR